MQGQDRTGGIGCANPAVATGTSKESSHNADNVRYDTLMDWPVEGMYAPGLGEDARLRIMRWLTDNNIDASTVSHVKVGRRSARIFTFSLNAHGYRYVGGDGHVALQPPTTIKRR